MVQLSPGYSFEDHCHSIGRDMGEYGAHVLKHVFPGAIAYTCAGVDDQTLSVVRADSGVETVFCVPRQGVTLDAFGR